ncbi:MAG: SOS response-associated peptidase [Thiohalocapsa sp.]|nr:SOS response-associated peptidase [Thiohalocapsa sp.]
MCGRFVQHADPEIYASRYGIDDLSTLERAGHGFNVAPTQSVLVIRSGPGGRQLASLRWGLVPHWSKGPDNRYSMINARAETVHEKPAYRSAFKQRRCLIPAEGFYEWQATAHGKQPYLIAREDGEPFMMAGLWETWHGDDNAGTIESCSIIVTDANDLMAPVHDRMPVILGADSHGAWLAADNTDSDALRALLQPPPAEGWTLHPVSKAVNNPRNDSADLLEPVDVAASQ